MLHFFWVTLQKHFQNCRYAQSNQEQVCNMFWGKIPLFVGDATFSFDFVLLILCRFLCLCVIPFARTTPACCVCPEPLARSALQCNVRFIPPILITVLKGRKTKENVIFFSQIYVIHLPFSPVYSFPFTRVFYTACKKKTGVQHVQITFFLVLHISEKQ